MTGALDTKAGNLTRSQLALPLLFVISISSSFGTLLPLITHNFIRQNLKNGGQQKDLIVEPLFVPLDEVVVNLNEGRLTRYLRLRVSLQINKPDESDFLLRLANHKQLLRNWMLSHLSDKTLDDIRGGIGQNRLRREIRDQFNTTLYPDGHDHIEDVLFEEFNIQ